MVKNLLFSNLPHIKSFIMIIFREIKNRERFRMKKIKKKIIKIIGDIKYIR